MRRSGQATTMNSSSLREWARVSDAHATLLPALRGAVAIYSPETARHASRVAHLAAALAIALGLSRDEIELVSWAGVLHDLGKLGVPVDTLRKRGPLTESDWAEIRRHPGIGADVVLAVSPVLAPLAAAIRAHHERWDGSGYPDGLAGNDIPLTGRILAISDAYDAITRPRPYRKRRLTADAVVEEIERCSGSQFDPALVRLLRHMHSELGLERGRAQRLYVATIAPESAPS